MHAHDLMLMFIVVVGAGVAGLVMADRARLPSIVFLLLFGVALGPDGAGLIRPERLGYGLEALVKLAVAVILFEGALTLRPRAVANVLASVRRLVTLGVALTWWGATVTGWLIAGLPGHLAVLFGALVTVTGPTVVKPLLQRVRVHRNVETVLLSEGVFADPVGVFLAVLVLELIVSFGGSWPQTLANYAGRLGVGAAIGAAGGWLLPWLLRSRRIVAEELQNLTGLAAVLLIFGAAETFLPETGLAAVVAAGFAAPSWVMPQEHRLRAFKEELTLLFISILFILLAANVRLDAIRVEGWPGVLTVAALMVVVRPLCVFFSVPPEQVGFRERLFLSAIAPRGIVAASAASLSALVLADNGDPSGRRVEALVFLTIAVTVVVQGVLAAPLAQVLGVLSEKEQGVIVVGANAVGRAVAEIYHRAGRSVVVVDTHSERCDIARQRGLDVVFGNALDPSLRDSIRFEAATALIAVTPNPEANLLMSILAREEFRIPGVFAALALRKQGTGEDLLHRAGVARAFGRPIAVRTWDDLLRNGQAAVVEQGIPGEAPVGGVDDYRDRPDRVPLAVVRDGRVRLCEDGVRWGPGDRVVFMVHQNAISAPSGAGDPDMDREERCEA